MTINHIYHICHMGAHPLCVFYHPVIPRWIFLAAELFKYTPKLFLLSTVPRLLGVFFAGSWSEIPNKTEEKGDLTPKDHDFPIYETLIWSNIYSYGPSYTSYVCTELTPFIECITP